MSKIQQASYHTTQNITSSISLPVIFRFIPYSTSTNKMIRVFTKVLSIVLKQHTCNWQHTEETNYAKSSTHTIQWPSTKTNLGRLGNPVTLEETYALYQSVTVWKRFAYSKRVTTSVGSSIHYR